MRPWAYGDVWDKMTLKERRWAWFTDLIAAFGGAGLIYWLAGLM